MTDPLGTLERPQPPALEQNAVGATALSRMPWYAATLVCVGGVFAADAFTRLGFAHGTLYIAAVLLAAMTRDRRFVGWVAVLAVALTAIGVLVSPPAPPGVAFLLVAANRLVSMIAVAIVAFLAVRVLKHIQALDDSREALSASGDALRHQLLLVQAANRMAHLGGWWASVPELEITWSDETCRIHGLPPGVRPSLQGAIDHYLPEWQPRIWSAFDACVHEGRAFDEEAQLVTASGQTIWVRSIGQAVRDADGRIVRIEGALQDLSLEKHEESFDYQGRRWFRELADAMPQIVWTAGADGQIDYSSRAFHDYIGADAEGRTPAECWRHAIHPEDLERVRSTWAYSIAHGEPYRIEYRLRRADGVWRWHLSRGAPIRNGLGQLVRWYGTTTDIDEVKLLERAANQAAQQLLTTLDSIGDGFVSLDRAFRFRFVNHRAESYLQRSRDTLAGLQAFQTFPQFARTPVETALRDALRTGRTVELEQFVPGPDRWFSMRAFAGEDGLAVYFRDITRRRLAEQEARIQGERFSYVVRAVADAVWDWDLIQDTVWWSEGMQRLFGHDPAARPWPAHIHPEDRERVLRELERLVQGEASHWHGEYRFLRQDGLVARVVHRGFVIRDAQGKAVRIVGGMTDVTERALSQERLLESQRLESMGQMTGGVAHDFNNLLTVILGNAEMLSEALADSPRLRPLSEMIAGAAQRGADLTRSLLTFARRQALEPQVVDVKQLLSGLDGLLRRAVGEQVVLDLAPGDRDVSALVDPAQLEGALLNLSLNARDAMPGGGRLSIGTTAVRIGPDDELVRLGLEPGDYVRLEVRDTGTGIAPEDLPHVFEPFFTTKEKGKGTGLGLSMVYGFVKQSRGHVSIDSAAGCGTVVRLYLPRAGGPAPEVPAPAEPVRAVEGSETILLVEDDDLVRRYGSEQLASMGYRVLLASDGAEALEVLRSDAPIDLLFTDVVMPGGMSGRDLADEAQRVRPGLKVLFTSGYAEHAIVHHGRLDPGVQLLGKPYRRAELARKVRAVLDGA